MDQELKTQLKNALAKLERVTQEVAREQGYNLETEKLNLLAELIKEQVNHESSGNTTR